MISRMRFFAQHRRKDVEELGPSCTACSWQVKWYNHFGKQFSNFLKSVPTIQFSHSIPRYLCMGNEGLYPSKDLYTYMFTTALLVLPTT